MPETSTVTPPETSAKRARIETAVSGVVSKLTPTQRTFVIEYLLHGNAKRAAEVAGYASPEKQGPRLRHHERIQAAIDEYFHQQEMGAREVIALLSNQARGTMADFIHLPRNAEGEPIRGLMPEVDLWKAEDADQLNLIKKIKTKRTITTTKSGDTIEDEWIDFELYDSQSALEKIGRYHGLFGPRGDVDDPLHTVGMTLDEWREEQERRRAEAEAQTADTLGIFEEDDESE